MLNPAHFCIGSFYAQNQIKSCCFSTASLICEWDKHKVCNLVKNQSLTQTNLPEVYELHEIQ
jgi:hypothetical protein